MSPTRRDVLTAMAIAPMTSLLPATVLAEDWNEDNGRDDDPAVLHTARFEMAFFMEDGRPITINVESEFDVDGGIWTTAESSRIGKIVSCEQHLDALGYLRDLQILAEEVATAHRFHDDGGREYVPQRIRTEPPITIDIHG